MDVLPKDKVIILIYVIYYDCIYHQLLVEYYIWKNKIIIDLQDTNVENFSIKKYFYLCGWNPNYETKFIRFRNFG